MTTELSIPFVKSVLKEVLNYFEPFEENDYRTALVRTHVQDVLEHIEQAADEGTTMPEGQS